MRKRNVLFICSRNQWRSPTAETLWRKHMMINVRSAGVSSKARRTVSESDIGWADDILVMENKHRSRLKVMFGHEISNKNIHILDIEDLYEYMDDELVQLLEDSVPNILGLD